MADFKPAYLNKLSKGTLEALDVPASKCGALALDQLLAQGNGNPTSSSIESNLRRLVLEHAQDIKKTGDDLKSTDYTITITPPEELTDTGEIIMPQLTKPLHGEAEV